MKPIGRLRVRSTCKGRVVTWVVLRVAAIDVPDPHHGPIARIGGAV